MLCRFGINSALFQSLQKLTFLDNYILVTFCYTVENSFYVDQRIQYMLIHCIAVTVVQVQHYFTVILILMLYAIIILQNSFISIFFIALTKHRKKQFFPFSTICSCKTLYLCLLLQILCHKVTQFFSEFYAVAMLYAVKDGCGYLTLSLRFMLKCYMYSYFHSCELTQDDCQVSRPVVTEHN